MEKEIPAPLLENLKRLHITSFTQVQKDVFPLAMQGKDLVVQSPTGSGKTLAYCLPILSRISVQSKKKHAPVALVLCPTRELVLQVAQNIRDFLSNQEGIRVVALYGGSNMNSQIRQTKNGGDIVVGTPGRVYDHLRRHTLKTNLLQTVVFDEADEMLSMGFQEQVEQIIASLPPHQTLLFSATYNAQISNLISKITCDPVTIKIQKEKQLPLQVQQMVCICSSQEKEATILSFIKKVQKKHACLFFCNTRKQCEHYKQIFSSHGLSCASIHSEMNPKERKAITQDFRAHRISILIATDVAARGLDITGVSFVIQESIPSSLTIYRHRIGRVGRAGAIGQSILFLKPNEKGYIQQIEDITHEKVFLFDPKEKANRSWL